MRRGIAAYARTDDSAGAFGDTLRQIAALHLQACSAATPEPESLGAALFELQVLDEWGFFDFEDYAPLLGEKGIARYRAFAEKAWHEVPVLQPGARREPESGRYIITRVMETLARHSGNADALVAVKSRDLSHPQSRAVAAAPGFTQDPRPGSAARFGATSPAPRRARASLCRSVVDRLRQI